MYSLKFTNEAKGHLDRLKKKKEFIKLQKIKNTLDKLQNNPRYPGLHTHKYQSVKGKNGEDIFQSYVENKTPGAFRIFWHYGTGIEEIVIIAITPHP